MTRPYRARINQPSTLQPLHALDGKYCIAVDDPKEPQVADIYFTEGDTHSMRVNRSVLSKCKLSSAEN